MREPVRDRGALLRALRRYREAPLRDQLFVRARAFLADLAFVEAFLPRRGFIVELGCGHGLFSNLLREASDARRVLGVDADERKIAVAKLTEREGLRFEIGDVVATPAPPCDSIAMVDLLYLLSPDEQERVIAGCARSLTEGRTLVVYAQEARVDPRFAFGYAQEIVSTSLRLTKGRYTPFTYLSRGEMRALLERHGFAVDVVPLPRRPYTDAVYVARRVPRPQP